MSICASVNNKIKGKKKLSQMALTSLERVVNKNRMFTPYNSPPRLGKSIWRRLAIKKNIYKAI